MAEEAKLKLLEWKIQNFSCWREAVHGKSIKSPDFTPLSPLRAMELYPRGQSGQDDKMKLRLDDHLMGDMVADLTIVRWDGCPIYKQRLEVTRMAPEVTLDLKFKKVVPQMAKGGEIILRLCGTGEYEQRVCTTMGVWEVSFAIGTKFVEGIKLNPHVDLGFFRYSSEKAKGMYLSMSYLSMKRQDKRIRLELRPDTVEEGKPVLVESSSSLLNRDNKLVRMRASSHTFADTEAWNFSSPLTVKEWEKKGITIHLSFKVINGEIIHNYNSNIYSKNVKMDPTGSDISFYEEKASKRSVMTLSQHLMCVHQDFSDCKLKCGDIIFPVHKNVLRARAPVFTTRFSIDKRMSRQVVIEDLDPSTLSLFLTYLYTGVVEKDLECARALKLYHAADKYKMPPLKEKCVESLRDNMSVSNFCDIVSFAAKYGERDLTAASYDFLLNNSSGVLESKEWDRFSKLEPMLFMETWSLALKRCKRKRLSPWS